MKKLILFLLLSGSLSATTVENCTPPTGGFIAAARSSPRGGKLFSLSGLAGNAPTAYEWSISPVSSALPTGSVVSGQNTPAARIQFYQTGQYIVSVTVSNGCGEIVISQTFWMA